eukprot:362855-Chlamydomonas_euryale.AAC.4
MLGSTQVGYPSVVEAICNTIDCSNIQLSDVLLPVATMAGFSICRLSRWVTVTHTRVTTAIAAVAKNQRGEQLVLLPFPARPPPGTVDVGMRWEVDFPLACT